MLDLTTLDLTRLTPLRLPPTYYISRHMGSGCFMDPPGYPTYFIQSIYTRHGNTPNRGATQCIQGPDGVFYAVPDHTETHFIRDCWLPLPFHHPRVQAWCRAVFGYFKHGWVRDGSMLFSHDPCKTPADIHKTADMLGLPLTAYRPADYIRGWYDVPSEDLIQEFTGLAGYGRGGPGDWWERHDVRPDPEHCPGDNLGGHRPHPTSMTWCQFCGWVA